MPTDLLTCSADARQLPSYVEAKATGSKRYRGRQCLRGHSGERYTSSKTCVTCVSIAKPKYINPERKRAKLRQWKDENRILVAAHAKKQKAARARPISKFWNIQIREFYANRPSGMTVDHIVPLHGAMVSGLHVPWNLQYLTGAENGAKGNRFA